MTEVGLKMLLSAKGNFSMRRFVIWQIFTCKLMGMIAEIFLLTLGAANC